MHVKCYLERHYIFFNSLIKPYPTCMYEITVWGNTFKKYLKNVSLVEKLIIQIITFSDVYATTAPLCQQMGILNVNDLHIYFAAILILKCMNNKPPIYLTKQNNVIYYC